MKDKTRLKLRIIVGVLVILTGLTYLVAALRTSKFNLGVPAVFLAVAGMAAWIILKSKKEFKDVKMGMKIEDERSKKLMAYSMARAYLISIWYILALMWYDSLFVDKLGVPPFRDPSQALGIAILGMAILFGISYLYYSIKGDME